MTNSRGWASAGVWVDEQGAPSIHSLPDAQDETRRLLRRAARVLRGAAAQRDPDPELLAAAQMVLEAGERR